MNFKETCDKLEGLITDSYQNSVTLGQAETLAGRFLEAQLIVNTELTRLDLDARMRKTGVKAIRATIYLSEKNAIPKPTEGMLTALIDANPDLRNEQDALDKVESERDELKRLMDVYNNTHVHFRTICRGGFGG